MGLREIETNKWKDWEKIPRPLTNGVAGHDVTTK